MTIPIEFLATIIANPDDDAPRLMLADMLEERGDPRADFIRVQCELTRPPSLGLPGGKRLRHAEYRRRLARQDELHRRERELLESYGGNWIPVLVGLAVYTHVSGPIEERFSWLEKHKGEGSTLFPVQFRRGFVEHVTLPWSAWAEHHAMILASTPLREVTLTTWPFADGQSPYTTNSSTLLEILKSRWPRIKRFNLPSGVPCLLDMPDGLTRRGVVNRQGYVRLEEDGNNCVAGTIMERNQRDRCWYPADSQVQPEDAPVLGVYSLP